MGSTVEHATATVLQTCGVREEKKHARAGTNVLKHLPALSSASVRNVATLLPLVDVSLHRCAMDAHVFSARERAMLAHS